MRSTSFLVLFLSLVGGCHQFENNWGDSDIPDPTTWLELTLASTETRPGTAMPYTTEMVGDDGARSPITALISSDLEPDLLVTASDLTPTRVGAHMITATATIEGVTSSDEATLHVSEDAPDSFPPVITITNPERGTFTESPTDVVTGTISDGFSTVTSATVGGETVSLGPDGSFSHPLSYLFGLNVVETIATNAEENTGTDRRSVLQGSFVPRGSPVGRGIISRINQSTIDLMERFTEDGIDDYDLSAIFPYLAYSDLSETCVLGACVTWYALDIWVHDLRRGRSEVELDPRPDGTIHASIVVYDLEVDWTADGTVSEIDYDTDGMVTADTVQITSLLTPSVSDGLVHVAFSDVDVSSSGFVFDWDSWVYDAASFFGVELDSMVRESIEESIEEMAVATVPSRLEAFLQDLELGTTVTFSDNNYTITAIPSDIEVNDHGLTLALDTIVEPSEWRLAQTGLGSLYANHSPPAARASPGMILSFSADFINQTLYALWGGGVLNGSYTAEELGIDPTAAAALMPELAEVEVIVVNALLPPVVLPGSGDNLADLQLGDLEVLLYSGDPSDPSTLLLHEFFAIESDLDLRITERSTLAATLSDVRARIDVTAPLRPDEFEIQTEILLTALVPVISSQLSDAIEEIPIPAVYGFILTDVTIEAGGPSGGYFDMAGELTGI